MQQMTLGAFVKAVAAANPKQPVYFDWCRLTPTKFGSYRGYYDQLALGVALEGNVTAGALAEAAQRAVGATFEGWKGGKYQMTRSTPLWVDNPGEATGTQIVGVRDDGWALIIQTKADAD